MARDLHRNGGRDREGRRRESASASSSEITAPIDRPSLFWMALTSLRIGSSMSMVVRMMRDAMYLDIRCHEGGDRPWHAPEPSSLHLRGHLPHIGTGRAEPSPVPYFQCRKQG